MRTLTFQQFSDELGGVVAIPNAYDRVLGMMSPADYTVLLTVANAVRPCSFLDIGCRNSATARVVCKRIDSIKTYIGVDLPDGSFPRMKEQAGETASDPGRYMKEDCTIEMSILRTDSLNIRPAMFKTPIEMMLIDGGHDELTVLADTDLAVKLAPRVVFWHDRYFDSVQKAIRAFECRVGGEAVAVSGSNIAYHVGLPPGQKGSNHA